MKKRILIIALCLIGFNKSNTLPQNLYLAEVENNTDTMFYFGTSTYYLTDLEPTTAGGLTTTLSNPNYVTKFDYMTLNENAKNPSSARFINGKGTFTMDTNIPNYAFSGNTATPPTKNDWQSGLELANEYGASLSGMTKTILLVPLPSAASIYNDTCDPVILLGLKSALEQYPRAESYRIAKSVGTTNCCPSCGTDTLMAAPVVITNFPTTSSAAKLKLIINNDFSCTLQVWNSATQTWS